MKRKLKNMSLQRKKSFYGLVFVIPWIVGVIPFFIIPLIRTVYYSFTLLTVSEGYMSAQFVGIKNYIRMFTEDPVFIRELVTSFRTMVTEVPLIVSFGIFFAILLNQKFRGRTLARAVLFLPVVVTSGVVIYILKTDVNAAYAMGGVQGQSFIRMTAITDILQSMGLSYTITNYISTAMSSMFDLVWKSGVQVLLFLASLQSIPPSSYEAASVEGASAWETFWKITFPILTPYLLIGIVYTIIDSFTYYGNNLMLNSIKPAFTQFQYSYAASMSIVYSLMVMLVLGVVFIVIGRRVAYTEK